MLHITLAPGARLRLTRRHLSAGLAAPISAPTYSTRIENQFALFISDIPDAPVKATDLGRAEGQFDHRTRIQRLLGARLGPTRAQKESRIRNQLGGPMLRFAFVVRSIEHQPRMGIGVLELNHGRLCLPEVLHVIGDAAPVMSRNGRNQSNAPESRREQSGLSS